MPERKELLYDSQANVSVGEFCLSCRTFVGKTRRLMATRDAYLICFWLRIIKFEISLTVVVDKRHNVKDGGPHWL